MTAITLSDLSRPGTNAKEPECQTFLPTIRIIDLLWKRDIEHASCFSWRKLKQPGRKIRKKGVVAGFKDESPLPFVMVAAKSRLFATRGG
jgi:hypothetical protein